ncbi:MAG TPA: agmatine deiminase family protein [Gammaproteobacteria bacterium]
MYRSRLDYVPAEWERQDGILLTWPRRDGDWSTLWPEAVAAFTELAVAIGQHQNLVLVCPDADAIPRLEQTLISRGVSRSRFRCCPIPADDTWSRDFGPIGSLRNGKPQLLNFSFNAWGGRYAAQRDNAINGALAALGAFNAPMEDVDFILEGGSIESDGAGTLLTTSGCLLSVQRNSAERTVVEAELKKRLPIERILWLESGYLAGDDTDSHIDNLARFSDAATILHVHCKNPDDEHFKALNAMETELKSFTDAAGKPYRLQGLPLPQPIHSALDGRRLPASYLNFLILNDAVLVPTYNDPADQAALTTIAAHFPGRRIVGIDSRTFIEQNGGVHCLTMQFAAGTLNPAFFRQP